MISKFLKLIFGSKNERELKRMRKLVKQINALTEAIAALDDEQLCAKTDEFKRRLATGESVDQILPEAFAVVREAGERTVGMRHFDVQLIGGITLHEGRIAEMRTGEGKTLVATLPAYLNALTGRPVHLITVNDYLATRDAGWMGPLYEFLGLRVGVVRPGQAPEEKREAYSADIVYGTNNEFGFDYLRDNMAFTLEDQQQGELAFAIVDEVDSILIDEARTPLIISGAAEDSSELYKRINRIIPELIPDEEGQRGHFTVDEKLRQVEITEEGHQHIEQLMVREKRGGRQSLRSHQSEPAAPRSLGAARPRALPPGRRIHRAERAGRADRRAHGTNDAGSATFRGPAPGDRGQGGRGDPEREPDIGLHHVSELFPPVRQTRRYDRHGGHGGL